ncbi:MAG: hypothetical protein CSA86_02520 [Arcobacter sp.]|nr:MAG: hypothetical protein CSA86_02520 [Arcobacter sp.]
MKNNKSYYISVLEVVILIGFYCLVIYKGPYLLKFIRGEIEIPVGLVFICIVSFILYVLFTPRYFHNETFEDRGINFSCIKNGWKNYLLSFIVGLIIVLSMIYHKSLYEKIIIDYYALFLKYFFYFLSAFAQALIFFSFLLLRIKEIVNNNKIIQNIYYKKIITIFVFSSLFALFHYPNWTLAFLSFFFALIGSWIFYTKPNIFLLVFIHATLGALLHRVYHLHMKIIFLYGHTEANYSFFRKLIPGIEQLIGTKW